MTTETTLVAAVNNWVTQQFPGEPDTADRAVAVARDAYRRGASVVEACRQTSAFLGSWTRHPSRCRVDHSGGRLAS